MQYRCRSCKKTFEVPEGDRARCPTCLRIHDLEPVRGSARPRASRYRGPAILFGLVAVAVGGYVAWYLGGDRGAPETEVEAPVEVGPMSADGLRRALEGKGLKRGEIVLPFEASGEVAELARKAARGKASRPEKVAAVLDAVRDLVGDAHEPFAGSSPRALAPKGPGGALAALRAETPFEPYSFELAALMVASLRAIDVPAVLAEVYRFEGEQRPADASGILGHFAVAVPEGDSYRDPTFHDPTTGRSGASARGESDVLTDLEAAGARLTLEALHVVGFGDDAARAERLASMAVRLRPSSATAVAARGTVRLLTGGGELSARSALEEYERALTLRPDPQRKLLVARILLAAREVRRAEELVRGALADAPDYGAAHGVVGLISAATGNLEEAQASIARAERLEPRDPTIGLLWVQYHIAQGDMSAAAEAARAVVDRMPDDPQPRLMLAQVLWEDARYEAAQAELRELLRRSGDNDQLREVVRQMFQYDPAGEDLESDEDEVELAAHGGDGGAPVGDGGPGALTPRLQMGKGLGKVRLGGPSGFNLDVPGL